MSEKPFEKHLADDFESGLKDFLLLPLLERLEKGKSLFWANREIYTVFEKYLELINKDIESGEITNTEEFFYRVDGNLKHYLNYEYQTTLHYLPYIFWFSHLIFDRTYSQLTYEAKEELRETCNLNTPKKRKDAFVNLFSRFIEEKVVEGGKESHWHEWTRLLFLSHYERFLIVIENARNEIKQLKKNKVAVMDIKREVLEKYVIPENCWNDVVKTNRKDKIARKWAKERIQKEFNKKVTAKMGVADSYLIKVLELARKDAEKHLSCCKKYSNHKLIFLKYGDPNFIRQIFRLKKEALSEIKFNSFVETEIGGMELYFI